MAVPDSTSLLQAAAEGGPTTLPSIEMPSGLVGARWPNPWFVISTTEGPIEVTGRRGRFDCRGTPGALCARWLIAPNWLPGLPGNNRSRQTVVFEPAGPRLVLGNRRGARLDHPCLTIVRNSARTYTVELQVSPEQEAQIGAICEQLWCKEREERERQGGAAAAKRTSEWCPKTPGEARERCVRLIGTAVDIALAMVKGAGLKYSDESGTRINRAYDELRRAFEEGGLGLATQECRRDGNVIYLEPGTH